MRRFQDSQLYLQQEADVPCCFSLVQEHNGTWLFRRECRPNAELFHGPAVCGKRLVLSHPERIV